MLQRQSNYGRVLFDYATALNLHDMEDERYVELQESHDKLEQ